MRAPAITAMACSVALLVPARQAWAQQPGAHYERGVQLRRAGQDDEGLREFRIALAEEHTPRTRAQVGLALASLGQWVEAEGHLLAALASSDPWVQRNRAELERALGDVAMRLGTLEVRGGVEGASLRIDGVPAGRLPLSEAIRVAAGIVNLQVSAEGYLPSSRRVTITARALVRETMNLAPALVAATVAVAPPPSMVPPTPPPSPRRLTPSVALVERGSAQRAVGYTLGGLAFGALAVGVLGSLQQNVEARYLSDNAPCRSANCDQRREREDTWQIVSVVGYVAAGALAATAAVVLATSPSSRAPSASATLRCGPWVIAAGASCGVVF